MLEVARDLMTVLVKWLAVLCIFAGLHAHAFSLDPCREKIECHGHAGQQHSGDHQDRPAHDQDCPPSHPCAGTCFHGQPYVGSDLNSMRLLVLKFSLALILADSPGLPEAPVLERDKPPLV